jgi:PTS system galactitol-specific IIA component
MDSSKPELLLGMDLRPEFVLIDIEADSNLLAIEILAKRLLQEGVVKPSFVSAVMQREEEYCTGLTFPEMGIAIPHTFPEHVINPCIGIASLKKAVTFQSMGMPDVPCQAEMLFMLGITDPDTQLDFLQTLMRTFQTAGRLKALKATKCPVELVELFKSFVI